MGRLGQLDEREGGGGLWVVYPDKKPPCATHLDTLQQNTSLLCIARTCPSIGLPFELWFSLNGGGGYMGAWGHFALAKRPPYMGIGTLCTSKKAPIYGHGDTLH